MPCTERTSDSSAPVRALRPGRRLIACALACAGVSARAATLLPGASPCLTASTPSDYGTLLLLQSASYLQQGAALPAEATTPGAAAIIQLQSPAAYSISNALVSGPAGAFQAALTRLSPTQSAWEQSYASDAALQAAFPGGSWLSTFHLVFPAGDSFVGFVPFALANASAPVPQIANFSAAQSIAAAGPFTLSWTPWVGAGAQDRIALHIVDATGATVFSAATDCGGATALTPGATGATLPANTLQAGRSYTGYLTFGAARVATNDVSSLLALRAEHARTTRFSLSATSGGGGGSEGTITQPGVSGTNFNFTLAGTPGTLYAIESTTTFAEWVRESEVTIPASGTLAVQLPLPAGGAPRFYRAISIGGGGGGGDADPATLGLAVIAPRTLRLTVAGSAGATYAIEQSLNYTTWSAITNVTLAAGTTSATVTVAVPDGTEFLVLRAVATGSVTPPSGKSPSVALVVAGASVSLRVTGGDASKTYAVQQVASSGAAGPDWSSWSATGKSVTTDASGQGTVALDAPAAGTAAIFYRVTTP